MRYLLSFVIISILCFNYAQATDYVKVEGWPRLAGTGIRSLGQVSALGLNSKGEVLAFSRAERVWDHQSFNSQDRINYIAPILGPTVLTFNASSGELVDMWGENTFYMPHGLTLDKNDNIWITDVGLHQVFKFSSSGEKLLELGVPLEPGSDSRHFCKPADVTVASDGTFFVADGYCNSRILKFSPEGRLLKQWGTKDKGSLPGQFYIPHSIKLDERTKRLYVADRENGRVQVFNSEEGTFVEEWKSPVFRRIFALDFASPTEGSHDYLFVVNGPTNSDPVKVFVLDMQKHGNIVDEFGDLRQPHDIVQVNHGKYVFVAEITLNTVIKYEKKRK